MEFLQELDRASSDEEASDQPRNTRGDKLLSYGDGFANSSDREVVTLNNISIGKPSENNDQLELDHKEKDRAQMIDLSLVQ